MPNMHRNRFFRGSTGAFSNHWITHKTYSGKTIITSPPLFSDREDFIESMKPAQAAMLAATTYANFAKAQPAYLEKELEIGITAYNLAIADWFGSPKVLEINVDGWAGKPGQSIRVKARDNVKVARVAVVIRAAQGDVLEMGEAAQVEADSAWWNYTTQSALLMKPFPFVQAIAFDLPGNRNSFTIS
jgi:hypothetical protein